MLYLIGGAPRCGKTLLSQRLATTKKISWISTDTIRRMILASTPRNQRDKKFPYGKLQRALKPYADLNQNPPNILLQAEITESKTIWPGIKGMIEDVIECQRSYVIEGVHLMPNLVAELKTTPYWKDIQATFLIKTKRDEIIDGFMRNASPHDWLSGALDDQELIDRVADMVQIKAAYVKKLANELGFSVMDTGQDFHNKLATLAKTW